VCPWIFQWGFSKNIWTAPMEYSGAHRITRGNIQWEKSIFETVWLAGWKGGGEVGKSLIYFRSDFQSQMAGRKFFYTFNCRVNIQLVCQKSFYFFFFLEIRIETKNLESSVFRQRKLKCCMWFHKTAYFCLYSGSPLWSIARGLAPPETAVHRMCWHS
jgi:hypothetical protein